MPRGDDGSQPVRGDREGLQGVLAQRCPTSIALLIPYKAAEAAACLKPPLYHYVGRARTYKTGRAFGNIWQNGKGRVLYFRHQTE